jgi:prepilin peptidase CpaA
MLMLALILAVALPAVWVDTREHRIPNKLVAITLTLGLALQVWMHGPEGILFALGGIAVASLFLLPFHMAGAMGAGDVKFMGALGATLGPWGALAAGAFTLIAGSILGLIAVGWSRWLMPALNHAGVTHSATTPITRIPYAAAIGTGSIGAAWWLTA